MVGFGTRPAPVLPVTADTWMTGSTRSSRTRAAAGKVTAVVGTHTHVQTADARVLPGGTAYVTDLGMSGPHDSVIGVRTDIILERFLRAHQVTDGQGIARFATIYPGWYRGRTVHIHFMIRTNPGLPAPIS